MADLKVDRKGRPINSALPQKGTVLEDAHRRVFAPPKTRDLCHPTELIPRVCLTENSVSQIKREPSYARLAGCHKIGKYRCFTQKFIQTEASFTRDPPSCDHAS